MTTLLVSMLGFGDYQETTYTMPGLERKTPAENQTPVTITSKYHQHLLLQGLAPDITWLVGTKDAKKKHAHSISHDEYIEIPKGANDPEFWEIFNIISKKFDGLKDQGDKIEIYLDLTHGFRVQPMFLLSVVRYYCRLYNDSFSIRNTYYSMFEGSNPVNSILDVSPILEMERIAGEVRAFLEHGSSGSLADRLRNLQTQTEEKIKAEIQKEQPEISGKKFAKILSERRESHPFLKHLAIKNELVKFGDLIGLNYTPGAADSIRRLCGLALETANALEGGLLPVARAFAKLGDELNSFFPEGDRPLWKWHAAIALWCLKRNFLQQALTHANELLTTRFCEETGLDPLNLEDRKILAPLVLIKEDKKTMLRPGLDKLWEQIVNLDLNLGEARNMVNHAFCRKTEIKIDQFAHRIREKIEELIELHSAIDHLPELHPEQQGRDPLIAST